MYISISIGKRQYVWGISVSGQLKPVRFSVCPQDKGLGIYMLVKWINLFWKHSFITKEQGLKTYIWIFGIYPFRTILTKWVVHLSDHHAPQAQSAKHELYIVFAIPSHDLLIGYRWVSSITRPFYCNSTSNIVILLR